MSLEHEEDFFELLQRSTSVRIDQQRATGPLLGGAMIEPDTPSDQLPGLDDLDGVVAVSRAIDAMLRTAPSPRRSTERKPSRQSVRRAAARSAPSSPSILAKTASENEPTKAAADTDRSPPAVTPRAVLQAVEREGEEWVEAEAGNSEVPRHGARLGGEEGKTADEDLALDTMASDPVPHIKSSLSSTSVRSAALHVSFNLPSSAAPSPEQRPASLISQSTPSVSSFSSQTSLSVSSTTPPPPEPAPPSGHGDQPPSEEEVRLNELAAQLSCYPWYVGTCSRDKAESLLASQPPGTLLVRRAEQALVLSVRSPTEGCDHVLVRCAPMSENSSRP